MLDSYNIQEIRELYGLSQEAFARSIGFSRELVNKVEKGRMKPSRKLLQAVQDYAFSHRAGQFSHDVNILGKASSGEAFMKQRLKEKNTHLAQEVPLVNIKAQAGYVKGYEEVDYIETLEKYTLPPGVNGAGAIWRYFEIEGDSMEPTLSAGDHILATMVPAEDWGEIKEDNVYIIHTTDQLLVKRLKRVSDKQIRMISDNKQYPAVTLEIENIRQLWMFRRHIRSRV